MDSEKQQKPLKPVGTNSSLTSDSDDAQLQEFFLPDLCNVQAVLFLVLVAELLAIVLVLAAGGIAEFSWASLSLTSLFVQWCFLLNAGLLCALRPRLSTWALPRAAGFSYLLIVTVVAITTVIAQWVLTRSGSAFVIDYSQLITNILICAVLAGIALRYFYLTQQLRLRQKTELVARIQALQSRIRPHFLFNSMNIIASLIAVDQDAAETAVEDLAGLFRASLAEVEAEVTLEEEFELCRRYARIEQLRLGERLIIEWKTDEVPALLKIPSLSLQPLLENAIYHGIQQIPDGGTVQISATYENNLLSLVVTNPIAANPVKDMEGNHLALENIHERLQAMYGKKASLSAEQIDGQYIAKIQYPINLEASK